MKDIQYNRRTIILAWLSLLLYAASFLLHKISLMGTSLGHYLKEGELTLNNWSWLYKNNFAYIDYEQSVFNHQWGLAVFYYGIQTTIGFEGLHLFLIAIQFSIWVWFIKVKLSHLNPYWMGCIGLLMIPLLFGQAITNPSSIACLFATVFFLIIYQYNNSKLDSKFLWILPILQLLWVNYHITFLLGWGILILGFIQARQNFPKEQTKTFASVLLTSILLSFINPHFFLGILNPIQLLFQKIAALPPYDQNIWSAYGTVKSHFLLYALTTWFLTLFSTLFLLFRDDLTSQKVLRLGAIFLFLLTGFLSAQNIPFIGIAALILLAHLGDIFTQRLSSSEFWMGYRSPVMLLCCLLPIFMSADTRHTIHNELGIGLPTDELNVLHFLEQNNIQGPIFNNRLSAGYLIYGLHPKSYLFVNDRYDSHSNDFLNTSYFPAILDDAFWHPTKVKYDFNVIVFALDKELYDNLEFLGRRMGDGEWALVYHQKEKAAILLRRNAINQPIINRFEISLNS